MTRNLLVISRGPGAVRLNPEPKAERNWTWLEIYWHPREIEALAMGLQHPMADIICCEPDRSIRPFRAAWKHIVNPAQYDAIALADDDVEPGPGVTWSEIFDLFHETGANLGQPALTHDSHVSHAITRRESGCRWRETNFIEVMCPIFSNRGVGLYWHEMDRHGLGFALETLWSTWEAREGRNLAILDATPVRHTRAVNAIAENRYPGGIEECESELRRLGLSYVQARTIARH